MANQSDERVTLSAHGVHCPVHGIVEGAEYAAQSPAPCGCDWEWEDGLTVLIAVPHRDDPLS
jgi:hypothetical protein